MSGAALRGFGLTNGTQASVARMECNVIRDHRDCNNNRVLFPGFRCVASRLRTAIGTTHPDEAMGQYPALEKGIKFVFDEIGQS